MVDRLDLSDAALEAAGSSLCAAAQTLVSEHVSGQRVQVQSLTNLGAVLEEFMVGLRFGRLALADAAQTAATAVAHVMSESAALDAQLAEAFPAGFAMPGEQP